MEEKYIIPQLDVASVKELERIDFIGNDFAIFDDVTDILTDDSIKRVNVAVVALCLEGYAEIGINLHTYEFHKNTLAIILPDQLIQNISHTGLFKGIYIVISSSFFDRTFRSVKDLLPVVLYINEHPILNLDDTEVDCIKEYHSFLWKKVSTPDNIYRKDIARGILTALFYELYNMSRKHVNDYQELPVRGRKDELFRCFMKLLSDNYRNERSVMFYAGKLCVGAKYLTEVVKEISGQTVSHWVQQIVMLEARSLLRESKMSIQEITDYLHFANPSFFGKYFKQYNGCSPKEYRLGNKNKS